MYIHYKRMFVYFEKHTKKKNSIFFNVFYLLIHLIKNKIIKNTNQ